MLKFNEDFLQLIWQHRLLKPSPLFTKSGQEILILKTGDFNHDAGPDFFNARIKLGDVELVGSIEVHLKTSDWLKHGHQRDKSYDTIILHVVYEHDTDLPQNVDNGVQVLELKGLIEDKTLEGYGQLLNSRNKLPCLNQLHLVHDLKFTAWMQRMVIERLEEKNGRLEELFKESNADYTQVFYTALLRNFGFKVNALPFELLARHLPFKILLKHSDNLLQLECLLLGMAGLLENQAVDKHIQNLQNEFEFLKNKYGLMPLKKEIFKFSRLRPANFPTIRLAQLAALMHENSSVITKPQDFYKYDQLAGLLNVKLQGYWKNRYTIDGRPLQKELALGGESVESIIINTFAPFFFFYSKKTGNPLYLDTAMELLAGCAFESNSKTRVFGVKKAILKSSADSQGIINLYDNYCTRKRCLKCGIGMEILKPS